MAFSVQNICGLLIRSRLMTPDEMRAMSQRWEGAAAQGAGDLGAFLKWLVASGYVTEYQAGLLGQGHADCFFLNQYRILERIGRGRMAGVYKAVHSLGQVVAIKVLPPSRAKSPPVLARFQREARLAMRLNHPHVVRSFQVGEAGGVHYLVMEHLEGEPLDELLRRRKTVPAAEACRLAHQTLLGLQYIHEQGMVHRDLKPANLFLAAGNDPRNATQSTLKILDIGLARELFEEGPVRPAGYDNSLDRTAEGVLLGTPDYLSPEQARDARRSDIRADIYSVGCVLYHLLTGQPPFPEKNLFRQIVRHATETPQPLRTFNPALPESLEQILGWMVAKDPAQRYPTPARAAQALEMFLLVDGQPARTEEAPQLRTYLTWLETEVPTAGADEATIVAPPAKPKTLPAIPIPPAVPAARPAAAPRPVPALSAADIDVELVSPTALAPAPPPEPESGPLIAPKPIARRAPKRGLLIGIAAAALVLSCGCAGVAGWVIKSMLD